MTIAVYKITCTKTNKTYIGSSNNAERRMTGHRNLLRKGLHGNRYLQNAWNKYDPLDFSFEIVEICSLDELREREQYWIDNTDNLFNIKKDDVGTLLSVPWSEETRKKVEATNKTIITKNRRRESALRAIAYNPNRKGLFTKETAVAANLKKTKKFIALSPDEECYFFNNINNFCREYNLNQPNFTMVANGRRNFHLGWRCLHATEERLAILISSGIEADIAPNLITKIPRELWAQVLTV